MTHQKLTCLIAAVLFCVVSVGCGGSSPDAVVKDANKTNLARLTNLYVRHQMENQMAGPADEASFKGYIRGLDNSVLELVGVDKNAIDELFVSERDSQPFKIIYGVEGNPRGANDAIVFEVAGVDGKRMVGFTSTANKEIDNDADYNKLLSGGSL